LVKISKKRKRESRTDSLQLQSTFKRNGNKISEIVKLIFCSQNVDKIIGLFIGKWKRNSYCSVKVSFLSDNYTGKRI